MCKDMSCDGRVVCEDAANEIMLSQYIYLSLSCHLLCSCPVQVSKMASGFEDEDNEVSFYCAKSQRK